MNIYKAPNQIISSKRKVYRRGRERGHSTMNPSTHTHTHTLSLSLLPLPSLSPSPLSLSPSPPPHTHIHLSQCKEEKATGTGKDSFIKSIIIFRCVSVLACAGVGVDVCVGGGEGC